jgi:hypothetical protein
MFTMRFMMFALSLFLTEIGTTSTINVAIHGDISQVNLLQSTQLVGNKTTKFVVIGTKHDQRLQITQLLRNGTHDPIVPG